ncbi:hypothetical protein JYT89_02235 [Flavobacteriaceae bacterium AH-315-B10]|nr:hypothetical protein [Flavobacteriaceae bacterium AH-315-B10]
MKHLKIPYYLVALILCCFSFNNSIAQKRSFDKDSLRIKVYTEIEYVNSQSREITVKKVFCDYCSENQIEALKVQAKELAFYDRYNPKKRMVNGIRKFAIIIRVSKKDLKELEKENDSINN